LKLKKTKWMGVIVLLSLLMTGISFGERGYDLDEFDDLELESLDSKKEIPAKKIDKGQRLILFDDNLYLLDDDLGEDELELQKLELDPDDMETAKEYKNFLNAFFEDSTQVGTSSYSRLDKSIQKQPKKSSEKNKSNSSTSRKVASQTKRSTPPTTTFRPTRGVLGFGVSTIIGTTIPVKMKGFSTGYNLGIHVDTPISFNLAGMEANIGADLYFFSMSAIGGSEKLKLANIIGNVSLFPFSSIEIRTGLGFTPISIGDYSVVSALSIPVDVNYYLPINFSGFNFVLNLHAQRTLGHPSQKGVEFGDATDFLYLGFLIQFHHQLISFRD